MCEIDNISVKMLEKVSNLMLKSDMLGVKLIIRVRKKSILVMKNTTWRREQDKAFKSFGLAYLGSLL